MKVVQLGAGAFEVAVVVEALQAPEQMLTAAAQEGDQVSRPQEPVTMDEREDVLVAFGQAHRRQTAGPAEAGETGVGHPVRLTR
jgi:hypothetical protein